MHGLPTLDYLHTARYGEGSDIAKQVIDEHGPAASEESDPLPVAVPAVVALDDESEVA